MINRDSITTATTTPTAPQLLTELGPWSMSAVKSLDYGAKVAIIDELCLQIKPRRMEFMGIHSKTMVEILKNIAIEVDAKWNAFIAYCEDASNQHRQTYIKIVKVIPKAMEKYTKEMLHKKQYATALRYAMFSDKISSKIIALSIYAGDFRAEYLSKINFTKAGYIKEFMREEIIDKTLSSNLKRDVAAFTLGTSLAIETVGRSSVALFAYQGRHYQDQMQITSALLGLSQLSEILSLDGKRNFMADAAMDYQIAEQHTKSEASAQLHLIMTGQDGMDVKKAWRCMINYLVAEKNGVFIHNGKRFFNVITASIKHVNSDMRVTSPTTSPR